MAFSFLEYLDIDINWHNGRHLVSFVMYISSAKFEDHCSIISKELNIISVFYCFIETTYDIIFLNELHNIKTSISLKCISIKLPCIRPLYNHSLLIYIAWRQSVYLTLLFPYSTVNIFVWNRASFSPLFSGLCSIFCVSQILVNKLNYSWWPPPLFVVLLVSFTYNKTEMFLFSWAKQYRFRNKF